MNKLITYLLYINLMSDVAKIINSENKVIAKVICFYGNITKKPEASKFSLSYCLCVRDAPEVSYNNVL